jgi:hypothetical protein
MNEIQARNVKLVALARESFSVLDDVQECAENEKNKIRNKVTIDKSSINIFVKKLKVLETAVQEESIKLSKCGDYELDEEVYQKL